MLRRHCEAEGRHNSTIQKTLLWVGPPVRTDGTEHFLTEMRQYAALGIDAVLLMPGADDPVAEVRGLAPVVKKLRIHPFSPEARIPQ